MEPNPGSKPSGAGAARFAGLLGAGMVAARGLGLVRDILLAYFLGTGLVMDAWLVAFRIPNVLRVYLTEGSFNPAFIPVFNEYLEKRGYNEARRLANTAISVFTVALLGMTLLGSVLAPVITRLIAPGFADSPEKLALAAHLMRWCYYYLFFTGVGALLAGMLQSLGNYRTSALSQIVFNVILIFSILFICPLFGEMDRQWIHGVLAGSLFAGLIQLVIHVPSLHKLKMLPRPSLEFRHEGVQRIGRLIPATFLGIGVSQFALIMNAILASMLVEGSVAALEYAHRITQFFYIIAAGAVSAALLPLLSRQASRGEHERFKRTLIGALRVVWYVMVPLAILTLLLAEDGIRLLLERGSFTTESTALTALALACYAPIVVSDSTLRILTVSMFSMQDTRTPAKIALVTLATNAVLAVTLMQWLDVGGLALAGGIAPFVGVTLLFRSVVRKVGRVPLTAGRRTTAGIAFGSVALVAATMATRHVIGEWAIGTPPLLNSFLVVAVPGLAGAAAYLAVGLAVRAPELGMTWHLLRRRRDPEAVVK